MKILIASDLHGSAYYCRALLGAVRREEADRVVLLGDLLYHGPRNDLPSSYAPKKVIEILSSLSSSIIAVRGNCEAEVDQMVLPFPVLSESTMIFADSYTIFMTHGHIYTPDKHPAGFDAFFSGHTHIPVLEKRNGITYLNPGSVSIPKGGFPPSYAIWDGGNIEVRNLDDDSIIFSLQGRKG